MIILLINGIFLMVLGVVIIFYWRQLLIRKNAREKVEGHIIAYKYRASTQVPLVEYEVNNQFYKQTLKHDYVVETSSPYKKLQAFSKDDLLSPHLKIERHSLISYNDMFRKQYPLGHRLLFGMIPKILRNPMLNVLQAAITA